MDQVNPNKYYLGIDPGSSSGAWAILTKDKTIIAAGTWPDFPDFTGVSLACLEKVHAMPSQGVSSTFVFGENYGFWKGALAVSKVPFINVTPQTWQKGVLDSLPTSTPPSSKDEDSKTAGRRRAGNTAQMKKAIVSFVLRTIPSSYSYLKLKKHWGIADAICMALYAIKFNATSVD